MIITYTIHLAGDTFRDEVMATAPDILRHHGARLDGSLLTVREEDLYADDSVRALWVRSPWQITQTNCGVAVTVDYRGRAAARPGETHELALVVRNPHPDRSWWTCRWPGPPGWPAVVGRQIQLGADAAVDLSLPIVVPSRTP